MKGSGLKSKGYITEADADDGRGGERGRWGDLVQKEIVVFE